MSDHDKITAMHLRRAAFIYIRQSTVTPVEHNRESTARQYALADRAVERGWRRDPITIIDQDLGLSGASAAQRSGFAQLTTEVALGHVGIVLGLEVSRLARNNADGYRLLDLCGMTDTLIGDADGVYPPGLFNDRLVLGLKGTMSEAELHILRARLDGGIRHKRPPAASCVAACRLASSGAMRTARCVSTPMPRWSPPFARCSSVLPSWVRHEEYGSGFTPKA